MLKPCYILQHLTSPTLISQIRMSKVVRRYFASHGKKRVWSQRITMSGVTTTTPVQVTTTAEYTTTISRDDDHNCTYETPMVAMETTAFVEETTTTTQCDEDYTTCDNYNGGGNNYVDRDNYDAGANDSDARINNQHVER